MKDHSWLAQVMEENHGFFVAMARQRTRDLHQAQDLVSQMYLGLVTWSQKNPRPPANPRGFALVALRNLLRRPALRLMRSLDQVREPVTADPGPAEMAAGREDEARLWSLLKALDSPDSQLLILWAWGKSHAEIGAALGISEGASRIRLHRVLRRAQSLA